MLTLYPGNRMEELVQLMLELMRYGGRKDPLVAEQIIVQNPGMQHWLSMEMASHQGIAMNTDFPLLSRFIWKMMRRLDGDVPEQSPYAREVLVWRIYEALGVLRHEPAMAEPTAYWTGERDDMLKRFQLARTQADLYEQYLIYRPEWILAWDAGQFATIPDAPESSARWQGVLWHHLVQAEPRHPLYWIERSRARLKTASATDQFGFSSSVYLFGINTMAPLWWDFLQILGEHIDLHVFLLNPSDEYWGDLQSARTVARQRARWVGDEPAAAVDIGNPLLASLGRQGQEFIRLVYNEPQAEISVFSAPDGDTLLPRLQRDILRLHDATALPEPIAIDNSLVMTSAHSALREVQGLHDWLLGQFEADPTLSPRDVVVMCPAVEEYASYIEAVFDSGFSTQERTGLPRLPCSIADRSLSDSLPLVQSFMALMQLPDSRFTVNGILAHLRIPAVQRRFSLQADDLHTITLWLENAAIHWGIDATHKAQLDLPEDDRYTWQQGLERLLLGFAWGDEEQEYQNRLLLPWVEGDQAELLGKLIHLLNVLRDESRQWRGDSTAVQWQERLVRLLERVYTPGDEDQDGYDMVLAAIQDLTAYTQRAQCADQPLPLLVVQDFLRHHFSQPEQRQRFMTGQVTFCSMVPMRSIPFKVIAVLGLNDGQFPRQRQPLGFDLMAHAAARLGDRSRRGDDRYLFLEAILSARQSLYLSYQGRSVKNNEVQQPSLVLQELLQYVEQGYGWHAVDVIRQLPLQPFSPDNYRAPLRSYDGRWLQLLLSQRDAESSAPTILRLPPLGADPNASEDESASGDESESNEVRHETVEYWVRWFDRPAKALANARLNLYLETEHLLLEDNEPFVATHLDRYGVQTDMVNGALMYGDTAVVLRRHQLRQHLPHNPKFEAELDEWQRDAEQFSTALSGLGYRALNTEPLLWAHEGLVLRGQSLGDDEKQVFWRFANPKPKDHLRLWLHHLLANLHGPKETHGLFRPDTKSKPPKGQTHVAQRLAFAAVEQPARLLREWFDAWQALTASPWPLNAAVALMALDPKISAKEHWFTDWWQQQVDNDPYFALFWPEHASQPQTWTDEYQQWVTTLYQPLVDHLTVDHVTGEMV
ncbi:MAG: exodeoxyribonuclease V subunit gamma [Natronospirillum sp.]